MHAAHRNLRALAAGLAAAGLAAPPAHAAANDAWPTAQDIHFVQQMELRAWEARRAQDVAFFERQLADDHVSVQPAGVADKAAVLATLRARRCPLDDYRLGPITLHMPAPNLIVFSYRAEQSGRCGEQALASPSWVSSTYVRRDGQWANTLHQHTPARY